jgi:hypothetical protein
MNPPAVERVEVGLTQGSTLVLVVRADERLEERVLPVHAVGHGLAVAADHVQAGLEQEGLVVLPGDELGGGPATVAGPGHKPLARGQLNADGLFLPLA